MPDAYQLDGRTVRRIFDALAWVERQQSGARPHSPNRPYPIGTLRRFGVTCANPNTGVYPKPEDKPNTYWFKWYVEDHDLAQGDQTRDGTWLDDLPPPTETDPDGYWIAHNYTDDSRATKNYVPEGTLVLCSWHNERWWFQYQREEFWGRVTAAESVGTGQWKYTFEEVYKSDAAYGNWTAVPSGRSGDLYNSVEEVGDATAVPIPDNAVVEVHVEYYNDAGTVKAEYWCQYEEFNQTEGESSGDYETIDVMVCGAWNRCGNYLVIPQKRIYLPPGTTIEDLDNDVIPLHQCESSGDEPPESSGDSEPPDSDAGSSDFSFSIYDALVVSGTLTPDATGTYTYRGYFNGKPFWGREDNAYVLFWSDSAGCWMIYGGDAGYYWYKAYELTTPVGEWSPSLLADGIATVSVAP